MRIQSVKFCGIVLILLFTLATSQGALEAQQTAPR